jgi:uncharacterized protein (TIGR02646 family)
VRHIIKGAEPASLVQHRLSQHSDFDNYPDKATLRQSLVKEQRGLCCYCLARIRPEAGAMKIEHWHSQDAYPEEQLDYRNLLASCSGNEGQPRDLQHCDTHKGNDDISRNPADPMHDIESIFHYYADGTIYAMDPLFNREINAVLNLNLAIIKNNRKFALDAFKETLTKRGKMDRAMLQRRLRKWDGQADNDELYPYCQVIVYWLRKRLARQ